MFRTLLAVGLVSMLSTAASAAEISLSELLSDIQREREAQPYNFQNVYADGYNVDEAGPRELGEVIMTRVRKGAGNCYAQGKCLYYSRRMRGEFCGECGKRGGCFPGSGSVVLESGDTVSMADLRVGDSVLAASRSGELTFSPVVSWLDKRSNDTSQYLVVQVELGHRITLSYNHALLVKQHDQVVSRFAGDVQPGDLLKVADSTEEGVWSPAVTIQPVIATGAYVPLTAEGTIVVDGVLASCYASFDHDWAHALTTPLRWFPALFETSADRDADGPRAAVELLKEFGRWLFPETGTKHRPAADDSVIQIPLAALSTTSQ